VVLMRVTDFDDGWESFCCYLIDNAEGETISEEALHRWAAAFRKAPRYYVATPPPSTSAEDFDAAIRHTYGSKE
jgi:hypothetical protein